MPEPTALVTGAHGFIGRYVCRALSRAGFAVTGVGHGGWPREEWSAWGLTHWHASDVTLDTLQTYGGEPDRVIHCAGSASVPFSMTHPLQDFRRTVEPTLAVLEFVRTRKPDARVALVSSGSVYGSRDTPADEEAPVRPESAYAAHKLQAERLCAEYGAFFGVRTGVVRLFSVYGAGLRKQLLWDASRRLLRGEAGFAGSGTERRDWLHVEDAAALLALAVERASAESTVVNGGTGEAVPVSEVVRLLARELRVAREPEFTGSSRAGDPRGMLADVSKARSWGWEPSVHWEDGVRAYAQWILAGAA